RKVTWCGCSRTVLLALCLLSLHHDGQIDKGHIVQSADLVLGHFELSDARTALFRFALVRDSDERLDGSNLVLSSFDSEDSLVAGVICAQEIVEVESISVVQLDQHVADGERIAHCGPLNRHVLHLCLQEGDC
ncbi:hypothetical protein PMAYCL1PPCAC_20067, partial [Pristionchus mayeri]